MAAHVWAAGPADLEAVSALLGEFRDWWGKSEPGDAQIRATVATLLGDPGTHYLLAATGPDAQASAVAQLRYRLSVWTGTDDCWLEDLYVSESSRRAGLGRALMEAAIAAAEGRGCRRMELDVNEENSAALEFYRSLGFTTEPKPPGRTLFVARTLDI